MMKKGSKIYSIVHRKCPRCHEGDLFIDRNPYHLKKLGEMPENCPVCGQSFSPEPGFYFGASYVSYGITIAIMVPIFVLNYLILKIPFDTLLFSIIGLIVLLAPIIYILSRSIWINFFVSYEEGAGKTLPNTEGTPSA